MSVLLKISIAGLAILLSSGCQFFAPEKEKDPELALTRTIALKESDLQDYEKDGLHEKLFRGIKNEEIPAYHSENFENRLKLDELEWRFIQEEVISFRPEGEGTAPRKDSIIENEIMAEDIEFYRVVETFKRKEGSRSYSGEIIGLAPLFNPLVEGERLSRRPLAYIHINELEDFLSEEDFHELKNLLVTSIKETREEPS